MSIVFSGRVRLKTKFSKTIHKSKKIRNFNQIVNWSVKVENLGNFQQIKPISKRLQENTPTPTPKRFQGNSQTHSYYTKRREMNEQCKKK